MEGGGMEARRKVEEDEGGGWEARSEDGRKCLTHVQLMLPREGMVWGL